LGSASELETHLFIAQRLHYIDINTFEQTTNNLTEIMKMLSGLIKTIKNKEANNS